MYTYISYSVSREYRPHGSTVAHEPVARGAVSPRPT